MRSPPRPILTALYLPPYTYRAVLAVLTNLTLLTLLTLSAYSLCVLPLLPLLSLLFFYCGTCEQAPQADAARGDAQRHAGRGALQARRQCKGQGRGARDGAPGWQGQHHARVRASDVSVCVCVVGEPYFTCI